MKEIIDELQKEILSLSVTASTELNAHMVTVKSNAGTQKSVFK